MILSEIAVLNNFLHDFEHKKYQINKFVWDWLK